MTTNDVALGEPSANIPRFGGLFWRLSRATGSLIRPLAGRSNPVFALVLQRGRISGRAYETPVAARRVEDGFVISLAFGAQVDWHRNLLAAGGGAIRYRGIDYPVAAPERVSEEVGAAAFHPLQRLAMRLSGVHSFVRLRNVRAEVLTAPESTPQH